MREVTAKNYAASTARLFLLRLPMVLGLLITMALTSRAGGPKCVAGTSYFDPSVAGQPLTWAQGIVSYYTDRGDLSPILMNASANSLVADAFSVWTAVPTAAISATNAGALEEDVSGNNVISNADGSISIPVDIQSTAIGTPVGVIYDSDGAVTSALLGAGAGDASQCFFNAVFGGNDNYEFLGNYEHGLIVINGQCAQQASQLDDVKYRLVRVIGSLLGLGWSQLNVNVQSGSPLPTSDDYAGFPVMHFMDDWYCMPITRCYANPFQLSLDDVAAVSRLYPVTTQNQSSFPGKQVFSATTARIHGSVYFSDSHGSRAQPMQGVNVVARWIDPQTGKPSRRYAVSSVSGFAFTGNAGNPVTGFVDSEGDELAEWGSKDQGVEGFFDLSGLQPPNTGAQYQLTVEAVDPHWSAGVGPYSPGPVSPSGTAQPLTVTVLPGNDVEQDILMSGSAQDLRQTASSWSSPAAVPSSGDWAASLSGYGDVDYFSVTAQSNRTLSVAVTALDDVGQPSVLKAQPVIGMWVASDPEGTSPPAFTASPFNTVGNGLTRLDASVQSTTTFLIGISDVRGDGRPDYRYHAHVLYADSVSPARVSTSGGAVRLKGMGFSGGMNARVGSGAAAILSSNATQMTIAVGAQGDGLQHITLTDAVSGASTKITGALTYGAAADDRIVLIGGTNPSTAAGTPAPNPMSVRVIAADGVTPVSGATVGWSATNGVQLSACNGAAACTVISDQSGNAWTWLMPAAPGTATITATLAPGVYSPAKSVGATLNATEASSDIGMTTPYLYVSHGATLSVPVTARVLSSGAPRSGAQVNFTIENGSGSLSAASAQTNSSGYATVTLSLTAFSSPVNVSACVAPGNSPCSVLYANPVALAQQKLQQVSGAGQMSTGAAFQPIAVRVTNSASPPNPVFGATVSFLTTVLRQGGTSTVGDESQNPAMPVILKVTQDSVVTDANGLASIVPGNGGFSPPVEVDVSVSAGTSAFLDDPLFMLPGVSGGVDRESVRHRRGIRLRVRLGGCGSWRGSGCLQHAIWLVGPAVKLSGWYWKFLRGTKLQIGWSYSQADRIKSSTPRLDARCARGTDEGVRPYTSLDSRRRLSLHVACLICAHLRKSKSPSSRFSNLDIPDSQFFSLLLLSYPLVDPVVYGFVPELGVLRFEDPVAFVGEVQHLRRAHLPSATW